jgi:glycosyltransferase involved in cell wall biosynthesis
MVNAITGVGYVFVGGSGRAGLLQTLVRIGLRRALGQSRAHTVVQNRDDRALVLQLGADASRITMIEGVGIDTSFYQSLPEPDGPIRFAVVTRMLWDKGIAELIDAARALRAETENVVIELVGEPDLANRATVSAAELRAWDKEGIIEYTGWCEDVRAVWARAHVAVLPSYREGMPKALLEAAACGRPIIATDVPGCRAVVADGYSGLLVPKGESAPIADAMRLLATDSELRQRLGRGARDSAQQRFSAVKVIAQFDALYRDLACADE